MPEPIDFFFDFSSPYGYLASERIDALGAKHGRAVRWHPILLGAVFKQTGTVPLTEVPIKGDYARMDFERTARMLKVPFNMPSPFPIATIATARVMLWLAARDEGAAKGFAQAAYRAFFIDNRNVGDAATAADLAAALGHDRAAALAAVDDPQIKSALKSEVEQSIARGVFGSPFFIVGGERFWGCDRIPMLDEWLKTGGW